MVVYIVALDFVISSCKESLRMETSGGRSVKPSRIFSISESAGSAVIYRKRKVCINYHGE